MARASPAFKATMATSEALKIEKGGNRSDKQWATHDVFLNLSVN
jgi:hypothetical protein